MSVTKRDRQIRSFIIGIFTHKIPLIISLAFVILPFIG